VCYIIAVNLFTDVLPWQRVLRSKVVLEYVLVEFAHMEEIFQSLIRSKQQLSDVRIFHNSFVAAALCMKKASNMTRDIIVL